MKPNKYLMIILERSKIGGYDLKSGVNNHKKTSNREIISRKL